MNVEQVGKQVLDAAFHVHSVLGPGLLESVYEAALTLDLRKTGLRVDVQKPLPVFYEGHQLEIGFRADLIVENLVLARVVNGLEGKPIWSREAAKVAKNKTSSLLPPSPTSPLRGTSSDS
jgi:hypothetical protein